MAIDFGGIGKKITDTAKGAGQKMKDTTEILKLEGSVKEETARIDQITFDLGKKYVESFADKYDPLFEQHFTAIKESRAKIDALKQQLIKLRGITTCKNCGTEIPAESAFCPSCGAKNEQPVAAVEAAPAGNRCVKCGAALPDGAVFCTECGQRVGE
jgi:rubrerythrin